MNKFGVTYFFRKPYAGHWSIEAIFSKLKFLLADKIIAQTKTASFTSRGFFKRVALSVEAAFYQSDVNHITGDIHYIATFLKPSKTVLTIHDCRILKETSSAIKRKIFFFFWYWMPTKRVKYITVVSAFTKQELLSYIPSLLPEKITIIPPFISEAFVYIPQEFNKIQPALLHIGTAVNKNLDRLIEAITGIPCTLTIIGQLSQLQKQNLLKYNIHYRSVCNISEQRMVEEYINADILTFISTFEGFGMPIIEANRVGRAVLTSNVASMPDVAQDAACLVDPFSTQSIRNGVLRLIGDDDYRNRLIENGQQNAKRFDNKAIAIRYYEIYCRIANGQ